MTSRRRQRPIGPDDFRVSRRGRHGLRREELDVLLARQDYRCAICGTDNFGALGHVVDHDHDLARQHGHSEHVGCRRCVRAVLCTGCNTVLGAAKDDPHTLRVAAEYIERWRAHTGTL